MLNTRDYIVLLIAALLKTVCDATWTDEIDMLPGLKSHPAFRQFSGYLYGSGNKKLHYWFVESSNNPKSDPLTVWLNGGPGCSSLFGLLSENGPFRIQDDGVTLENNPFSWNTVSNMLYIESPAGVGFSYASDSNYITNDDMTAEENFVALQDFFAKFPEYRHNELFIVGESYAGIYVPMLATLVLRDSSLNLKGFAVGNGVSNTNYLGDSIMYFAYYHGLIGTEQWNKLWMVCCGDKLDDHNKNDRNYIPNCKFTKQAEQSSACFYEMERVNAVIEGGAFDGYNLYGPCATGILTPETSHHSIRHWIWGNLRGHYNMSREDKSTRTGRGGDGSCQNNTALTHYLNQPQVRHALHVPDFVHKWENCADYGPNWYTKIYNDTAPFYHRLLNAGIRGIVFNGDVDMACNFLGDEWFVDSLQRPVKEDYRMWFYEDSEGRKQVAGFVKTFHNIVYLTVRGSGHMVPMNKPRPALKLFTNLIYNIPF